jgi:hypothetical protein
MQDAMWMVYATWTVLAVLALAGIAFAVVAERRRFVARGKGASWLRLRLSTLPIAALTAAAVLLPARGVGGVEALAVLYGLLLTLGPVFYFGAHVLVGRLLRPALARGEAAGVGLSGLLMVLVPLMLAQMLQPYVFDLMRGVAEQERNFAGEAPLAHRIAAQQRFTLPEIGEVWTEHWQAPAGVTIDHLEIERQGQYQRVDSGSAWCRSGQDVHVLWRAAAPSPRWRLYWRDQGGTLRRSDWNPQPPAMPAPAFTPVWRDDGVMLPARIARQIVAIGRTWSDGREQFDSISYLPPGQDYANDCLPLDYRPESRYPGARLTALAIQLWRSEVGSPARAVFRRPASAEAAR